MIRFELTHQEAGLLHRVLDAYLAELAQEIATDEVEDMESLLHNEQATLQKLLDHLRENGVGVLTPDMIGEYDHIAY